MTASEATASHPVVPMMAEFHLKYPDVRVDQMTTDSRLDIVHGAADVAFRGGSHPDDPRLVARRLPDFAWAIYCSRNYAATNGVPSRIEDIGRHDVIGFEGSIRLGPGYRWFIGHADSERITGRSNTVPNMTAVLRSGLGLGILPCFVGGSEADLVRCFDPPPEMQVEFWLLTSREARNSPQVRAFIDFMVPRILAQKRRFSGRAE